MLVLLLALAVLLTIAAVAGGTGVYAFGSSCDLSALREVRIGQNTFVYAADGSLLGSIPAERNRQPVPLTASAPGCRRRRWRSRTGASTRTAASTRRASPARSGRTSRRGKVVQGGSTITQQLVRNLYISNERTVQRKLKEACLAIKLNDAWSKQRILATYLNQVYYGNLAYGIEAAAQTYFSKPARSLNLPRGGAARRADPGAVGLRPVRRAAARRSLAATQVLEAMREQGEITPKQYAWAVASRASAAASRDSSTRRSASRTSSATSATS